jgi:hypothetical protein
MRNVYFYTDSLEETSKQMSNFVWRSVKNLDLRRYWNLSKLTEFSVMSIIRKCSNIETLQLPADPVFFFFTDNLHTVFFSLSNFELINYFLISQRFVFPLNSLNTLKRLRSLKLSTITEIRDYHTLIPTLTRLTSLSLNNGISSQILKEISHCLTQLRELKLSFVKNVGFEGLKELTILTELWHLNLAGFKKLTDEEMALLSHFSQLTKLNLAFGDFTEIGLTNLTNLTRLCHLNLEYADQVRNDGFHCLSHLTRLTFLSLSKTHCNAQVFVALTTLSDLRTLYISGCDSVDDLALNHIFNNFPSLIRFQRYGSLHNVTSQSLTNISKLSNLQHLEIGYSSEKCSSWEATMPCFKNITTLHLISEASTYNQPPLEWILKLTTLKRLELEDFEWSLFEYSNAVSSSNLTALSCFTSLELLSLCPVSFAFISSYLSLLTSLRELQIHDRCMKKVDVMFLSRMTTLTKLSVFGHNFDIHTLERLKQNFTRTTIIEHKFIN